MTPRLVSLAAVSVLALGVVGCNQTDQPAAPAPPPAAGPQTAAPDTTAPTPADPASPQTPAADANEHNAAALRAVATAEQAENGRAYEIDDEDDDNTWEVDVMVGDRSVEVKVSADGNNVISRDDDDDFDNDDRARLDRAQINLTQAIEAALREVPGRLDDAELDDEDNRDVWEVTIDTPDNDDIDVYVSPQDGSIIKVDR